MDDADPDFMDELIGRIAGEADYREQEEKSQAQRADADRKAAALRKKVTGK